MKKRVSRSKKALGILCCVLPVGAVAFVSSDHLAGSDFFNGPFQLDGIQAQTENAVDYSSDPGIDYSVVSNTKQYSKKRSLSTDLVEKDWVTGFVSNENTLGDRIECRAHKVHSEEISQLVQAAGLTVSGDAEKAFAIGKLLQKSRGSECHLAALNYFKKAVQSGNSRGFAEIANAYRKGLGVEPNFWKAVENFEISARLGYVNSAYRLIEMVEAGTDEVAGDPTRASAYLDEFLPMIEGKIRNGDAIAARSLGRLYGNTNLLQQDPEKAMEFLRHAVELGDAIAMHDLALMLMVYRSVGLKRSDIFPLLLRSSELGYSAAFTAIGRLHLNRQFGFPRDQAPRWFRWGVDAGHPGAMEELARLYFTGDIVAQDFSLAKELAHQGARLKHKGSISLFEEIIKNQYLTASKG